MASARVAAQSMNQYMSREQLLQFGATITHLAGKGNYTYIYFLDAPRQLSAKNLACFAVDLPQFVRIHKSYLINPDHVAGYQSSDTDCRKVALQVANEWLPVSKRNSKAVACLFKPKNPAKELRGEWYSVLPPEKASARYTIVSQRVQAALLNALIDEELGQLN